VSTSTTTAPAPQPALHAAFCARVLPAVERHARFAFRHLKCPVAQEDAIQETIGLSWKWFLSLTERGKDAAAFPSALAAYAARAVKSGRRVCGQERAKDTLSPTAQQRHGFVTGKLPDFSTLNGNPLQEALIDNTVSPVPDQAAFRLDFPAWLCSLSHRNRDIAEAMALGHGTKHLSRRFGLSEGRVSQLRGQFCDSWKRFHNEVA
jgi:hypothetical protein